MADINRLRERLQKAEAAEHEATEGLTSASQAFEAAYEGIVDGSPEQLEELKSTFKNLTSAVRANWRYRGLPVMTADRRAKALEATKKSQAKRKAKQAVPA